ncbi:hypothetical protein JCM3765_006562 [Sporobolomyces pararoseus]
MSRYPRSKPPSTRLQPPSKRYRTLSKGLRRQEDPKSIQTVYCEGRRSLIGTYKRAVVLARRTGSEDIREWGRKLRDLIDCYDGRWPNEEEDGKSETDSWVQEFRETVRWARLWTTQLICEHEEIDDLGEELAEWSIS